MEYFAMHRRYARDAERCKNADKMLDPLGSLVPYCGASLPAGTNLAAYISAQGVRGLVRFAVVVAGLGH